MAIWRHAARHGPEGQATTYRFEYGTSKRDGKQTPAKSAGSGSSGRSVAQAIGGLEPNTVYHFRIVATNSTGTTFGQDRTFRTRAAPRPSGGCGQHNHQSGAVNQGSGVGGSATQQNGCGDLNAG